MASNIPDKRALFDWRGSLVPCAAAGAEVDDSLKTFKVRLLPSCPLSEGSNDVWYVRTLQIISCRLGIFFTAT